MTYYVSSDVKPCSTQLNSTDDVSLQALCAVLEYEICDNNDVKMQMITTLQITSRGKRMYADLCERQIQLRELVSRADFLNSCYSAYVTALLRRRRGKNMFFAALYN